MPISDWIRLALLLILSLGATGIANWFGGLIIGVVIAGGLHWGIGWPWVLGLQAGWATIFVIPIFFSVLFKKPVLLIGLYIIVGIPTWIVANIFLGWDNVYAIASSIVMMLLFPAAIIRLVMHFKGDKPVRNNTLPDEASVSVPYSNNLFRSGSPERSGASSPVTSSYDPFGRYR